MDEEELKDIYDKEHFLKYKVNLFVDNGIVEVTADCDTMIGVYEV